uniref:Uncharacterized protein n=1 Tax=Seriola lalandi dorsalis TaxID=1841481 RepID=A0A3B4YXU2_SERLL
YNIPFCALKLKLYISTLQSPTLTNGREGKCNILPIDIQEREMYVMILKFLFLERTPTNICKFQPQKGFSPVG